MVGSMATLVVTGACLFTGFNIAGGIKNLIVNQLKKLGNYINNKVTESWLKFQQGTTTIWYHIGKVWGIWSFHMSPSKYMNMAANYTTPKPTPTYMFG